MFYSQQRLTPNITINQDPENRPKNPFYPKCCFSSINLLKFIFTHLIITTINKGARFWISFPERTERSTFDTDGLVVHYNVIDPSRVKYHFLCRQGAWTHIGCPFRILLVTSTPRLIMMSLSLAGLHVVF